jgi:riboflavin synthase
MFTGLIEQQGLVVDHIMTDTGLRLVVESPIDELISGESIAVNGVCLTVLPTNNNQMQFDVSPETLKCTTVGSLAIGDVVNIERAMLASTRLGGHYVSGHVDTTRRIQSIKQVGEYTELVIGEMVPADLNYLPTKGSISVDGVSLTVNEVDGCSVTLFLVPHTLAETNLRHRVVGDKVNIEFDYLAKMVAHQVEQMLKQQKLIA